MKFCHLFSFTCRLKGQINVQKFSGLFLKMYKKNYIAVLNSLLILSLFLTLDPPDLVFANSPIVNYSVQVLANNVHDLTISAPANYTVTWQLAGQGYCTGNGGLEGADLIRSNSKSFSNMGIGTYIYTVTCEIYNIHGEIEVGDTATVHVVQPTPGPSSTPTLIPTPTNTRTPIPTATFTPTFTPTNTPVVAYPGAYEPGSPVFTSDAFLDTGDTPPWYWMGGFRSKKFSEITSITMTFFGGAVDIFYPEVGEENYTRDSFRRPMGTNGLTINVYLDGVLKRSFISGPAGGIHVNTTPGTHTLKIKNEEFPSQELRCGIISQVVVYSNPTPFTPTFTPTNTSTPTSTPTPFPTPSYPQIYSLNSNKSPWKIISGSLSRVTLSNTVTIKIPANGSVYYDVRRDNTVIKQVDVTVSQTTGACDMSLYYNGSLAYRQVIPRNPNAAAAGYPKFKIRPRPHETRIDTVMLKAGSGDCYVSNVTAYGVGVSVIPMVPTEEPIPAYLHTVVPY